jgi:hypothetical protein
MNRTSADSAKKSDKRMTVVLALVVVAAIAIALVTARTSHGAGIRADEPMPATPLADESASPAAAEDGALSGEVLETVPVSKYTYLRLQASEGEVWAAVPSANVAVGSRVTISNATRMDDFKSATLGKSFKVIYFGTLGAPSGAVAGDALAPKFPIGDEQDVDPDQTLPPGHPDIGANAAPNALADDSNALPSGHPDIGGKAAANASPHGGMSDSLATAEPLPMPKLSRAAGSNGHVIAELAANRQKLAGQRVRVRGQVTKVTPDIQGRTFFHLRDDSGSSKGLVTDLVVTSVATPTRGQVATFEGTLRADDDIGIGYKYPVLLEDATVVSVGE